MTAPTDASVPTLNLIGCGAVGTSLGRLLAQAGLCTVQDVRNRSAVSTQEAVTALGAGQAVESIAALRAADMTLIGVPDGAIGEVAQALADGEVVRSTDLVFHCSGALGSDVLRPLRRQGCELASCHPVASFLRDRVKPDLQGVFCALEGDVGAVQRLGVMLLALGMRIVRVDAAHKMLYHAGSVFASNYLATLMEAALQCYEKAGLDRADALQLMISLVEGTLANIFASSPARALTGPIQRGDLATVRLQIAALQSALPEMHPLYRTLAQSTAVLAGRSGALDDLDGMSAHS